ncbi:MAG TPA: arginine--tRNA ligase [Gammaproteobacteria bacterium]|nr:arginine--tRNA ligase [Gammaproteobacteria bacterium]
MKHQLQSLIEQSLHQLINDGDLQDSALPEIQIDRTKQREHGDYSCNIAMVMARIAKRPPRDLATMIVAALPASELIERVELAGPGFINFFLTPAAMQGVVHDILAAGDDYGHSDIGADQKVIIEFVSANPTGPLHVGHGRGAAYGDALARVLRAAGYDVHTEYYVNDAGRQMNILAVSVWLRYLELCGEEFDFPANGYQGDYVWDIAASIHRARQEELHRKIDDVFVGVPPDEPLGGDKEAHIDGLIHRAQELLGDDDYLLVFNQGLEEITDNIRRDLAEFGVEYDRWYSERSLYEIGEVDKAITTLHKGGYIYELDGAQWFRSTDFGDEKDRVLVRDNGQTTYFASDIAYHLDKLERGFDRLIDIWGADHHGYVARVKAALHALDADKDRFEVLLVQFAILYQGGERLAMSTRSGEFVTLRELRNEVGNDAARFFYVMRKTEQHMDFDLDLAKSESSDNPVYYVQYAHARICSVMGQLAERGHNAEDLASATLDSLKEEHETELLNQLSRYPEVIENAAQHHEPHQLAYYLRELANTFHTYYNSHQFLVDDESLRNARLALIIATRHVLAGGLNLLGVSAPETM